MSGLTERRWWSPDTKRTGGPPAWAVLLAVCAGQFLVVLDAAITPDGTAREDVTRANVTCVSRACPAHSQPLWRAVRRASMRLRAEVLPMAAER
jgi:hypothetical protein